MGLISIGGLGSGLDVSSIIDALVTAERAPTENRLNRLEASASLTLTGLGSLSASLDELRSAAAELSYASSFSQRSVTISDTDFYTATATTTASAGSYDIEVESLATASTGDSQIFTGGSTTTFDDGTLTFSLGGDDFTISVAATDTLADIQDNINEASGNDFVTVSLINNVTDGMDTGSVLTYTSTKTGAGNDLDVTYTTNTGDTGPVSLATLSDDITFSAGTDASIKIDGFTATNDSNTFTDVIDNVTINILKEAETAGDTESLTVALDTSSTETLITGFVAAFNAFADVIKELGDANDLDNPGLLVGDYTLRQSENQIRNLIASTVDSITGEYDSLSSIGITTTQTGQLEIDDDFLSDALSGNFDDFEALFAGDDGFATSLLALVDEYTGGEGSLTSREETIAEQLSSIDDERLTLALRIETLTIRLTKQFSAMDIAVNQFNSTGSFLATQLANIPDYGNKK